MDAHSAQIHLRGPNNSPYIKLCLLHAPVMVLCVIVGESAAE